MIDTISLTTKIAYSVEQASEKTSLSKAFLRLEIKNKKLKIRRFGRRVLILDDDLREYLENGSEGAKDKCNEL